MSTSRFCTKTIGLALMLAAALPKAAPAAEMGHYAGGLPNIRDLVVPDEGYYALMYNYYYTTERINDAHGDKVRSVTINPGSGPGLTLNVDADIDVYVMAPTFMWVTPWKVLGARYAAYITPTFANSSVTAGLQGPLNQGVNADAGGFGLGDWFVQPLWLGWNQQHFDFALGYGFYAPTGKYDVDTVTLPVVGSVRVESPDNIGLGFWTNQFQGAASWYPWEDRRMAVAVALTYEIHSDKQDANVTPGQDLTLNWGISQYLPLNKAQDLLAEVGPSGYSTWQVTQDQGSGSKNPRVLDQVHAAGGQLGLTYLPWVAFVTAHYQYEYYSEDRPQGHVLMVSFGKKF